MHAGLTTIKCKPENIDTVLSIWRELTSEARKSRGLKCAYFFDDRLSGDCLAVGIWDNEELCKIFGNGETFRDFLEDIQKYCRAPSERVIYKVEAYWY